MSDKYDQFRIRGDRPAARIQEAIIAALDVSPHSLVLRKHNVLLAAWIQTCIEAAYKHKKIAMEDVVRAESCALGHYDYITKFPLYCEDLITNDKPNPWHE